MARIDVEKVATASLLLMAMLWGSTFFVIHGIVTRMAPTDMLAVRFAIAGLVLLLITPKSLRMTGRTLRQGLVMGVLFSTGQITQTIGLAHTSASISGFLTGLYVVATPLLGAACLAQRVPRVVWWAVALATAGLAVLSILPSRGTTHLGWGEGLTLIAAVAYAGHIVAAGHFATSENSMSLTLVQTLVLVAACFITAAPGGIHAPQRDSDWLAVLYLALVCGSLTLFLQIWAQAHVEPTRAAVVMCSEPVWAATFAILFGGESLTARTLVGGAAIVTASYLVMRPAGRPFGRPWATPRSPAAAMRPAHAIEPDEAGAVERGFDAVTMLQSATANPR